MVVLLVVIQIHHHLQIQVHLPNKCINTKDLININILKEKEIKLIIFFLQGKVRIQ